MTRAVDTPAEELFADLEFIARDAVDRIDLSVYSSGLDSTNAYDLIRDAFGRPMADRWLATYDARKNL